MSLAGTGEVHNKQVTRCSLCSAEMIVNEKINYNITFFVFKGNKQACKWQVKKLPENFSPKKLQHIVSGVRYEQNIY